MKVKISINNELRTLVVDDTLEGIEFDKYSITTDYCINADVTYMEINRDNEIEFFRCEGKPNDSSTTEKIVRYIERNK